MRRRASWLPCIHADDLGSLFDTSLLLLFDCSSAAQRVVMGYRCAATWSPESNLSSFLPRLTPHMLRMLANQVKRKDFQYDPEKGTLLHPLGR